MEDFQKFVGKVVIEFGRKVQGRAHIVPVTKNNGVRLTGITVTAENSNVSPTIYLEGYYEAFKQGKSVSEIVNEIEAEYQANEVQGYFDMSRFTDKEQMKKRLSFKLVNYERNEELLSEIPHRRFLDMAVVYYYFLETDAQGIATILIKNHHMSFWDITEEEMYRIAYGNYLNLHPTHIESMYEMVMSLMEEYGLIAEEAQEGMNMLIVTNREKLHGATIMLFPKVLKTISDLLGQDLYILPSSIHEILVLPRYVAKVKELKTMVQEVNKTCVSADEILAENVYRYSRESNTIEIVSE